MRSPYRRKLGPAGGFIVWVVDGPYIRANLEPEFTNFGEHSDYAFIPDHELWIDEEHGDVSEVPFFVEKMLRFRANLDRGMTTKRAWAMASEHELALRKKSEVFLDHQNDDEQELLTAIRKRKLKDFGSAIDIWLVDGALVRTFLRVDFTHGGHDRVYDFVPQNEIWIDDAIDPDERSLVFLHEVYEWNLMGKGMSYADAHERASALEHACRNGEDVKEMIGRELDKVDVSVPIVKK